MALPITVPYTFGNATTAIPLSNLDSDYATVYQAVNGIGNGSVALANVTITGGTVSNVSGVVPTPFTANGVVYASSTSALATGSALQFDGTNLSLGTSPSSVGGYKVFSINNATGGLIDFRVNGTSTGYVYTDSAGLKVEGVSTNPIIFKTNGSEQMRLDSSGNLSVGRTSGGGRVNIQANSNNFMNEFFNQSGTSVGSIQTNGTITIYGTTSDYRLKTVIGGVSGAGERIDLLEPIEYEFKSDGSRTRGFLAHKFQEVYAGSVTGTKDAVNADGNPVYQAMQASTPEVIADLVAEIQSLRKRILTLENK